MAITVKSMATSGVDGFMVEIEASTIRGQQQSLSIIGLPDQAIREAGERIQAAIESCGYDFPKDKSIISLAPSDMKKRGSHFDLGMIIALLFQTKQIAPKNLSDYAFIGELALDGRIRPCTGVLPMVTEALRCNVKTVVVPFENSREALAVSGINVYPVRTLQDTIYFLEGRIDTVKKSTGESESGNEAGDAGEKNGEGSMNFAMLTPSDADPPESDLDFSDVKGQDDLIEAIVLGAAGGHNVLMLGEPGCGKTMIAQRIPTILPKMSEKEYMSRRRKYRR